jgi:hypothetical protein
MHGKDKLLLLRRIVCGEPAGKVGVMLWEEVLVTRLPSTFFDHFVFSLRDALISALARKHARKRQIVTFEEDCLWTEPAGKAWVVSS